MPIRGPDCLPFDSLRNCLIGMRAETYPNEAPEIVDLELYLAWRARGLAVETPAVRP